MKSALFLAALLTASQAARAGGLDGRRSIAGEAIPELPPVATAETPMAVPLVMMAEAPSANALVPAQEAAAADPAAPATAAASAELTLRETAVNPEARIEAVFDGERRKASLTVEAPVGAGAVTIAGDGPSILETYREIDSAYGSASAWASHEAWSGNPIGISQRFWEEQEDQMEASRPFRDLLRAHFPALEYYSSDRVQRVLYWLQGRRPKGAPNPLWELVRRRDASRTRAQLQAAMP